MGEKKRTSKNESSTVVRVVGTSPLSFDVRLGDELTIKEVGPSAMNRPTLGGRFKSNAYLLFKGITKVGRLSPNSVEKIGDNIPSKCKVVKIDKLKKILSVEITKS